MEQKYYEIGDKFSFNGETYETKEETELSCEKCAFKNECQCNLQCGSNERKDGKDVYFEKVENMELDEEQISDGVVVREDAKINVDAIKTFNNIPTRRYTSRNKVYKIDPMLNGLQVLSKGNSILWIAKLNGSRVRISLLIAIDSFCFNEHCDCCVRSDQWSHE